MSELIALIPGARGGHLRIHQEDGLMIIGGLHLDLDGIAELVAACDAMIRGIREAGRDA